MDRKIRQYQNSVVVYSMLLGANMLLLASQGLEKYPYLVLSILGFGLFVLIMLNITLVPVFRYIKETDKS